ncbi:hypothetical protein P691DRAFT_478264 [Macrolepiota fuliginosa MF-IS2]|uniref:DUF6533 domain-containing protein n=1 Tax=Macrolepiota fuliginosa MF-IS2 TaxID=1400762 RepID=A0A9P6BYH8_9AGAR|nr:hypothetical protein P691DRAFT_478264 [Macrolepiota fuliginosa MF-IS2]
MRITWLGSGLQPTRIICLISASILVFDYLCSLDREVNLIWKRRLGSFATMLFLFNRYIPYVHVFYSIGGYWSTQHSQIVCQYRDIANAALIGAGLTVSELILCLRTWAIWECNRVISGLLIGMVAFFKIPLVLLALYHMLKDVDYIHISPNEIICISPVVGRWSWETLIFVVILCFETVIAVLTLIKAVEAQHSRSRWVVKIHYMGIIYYFFNLLMAIVNLIGTVHFHNMGLLSFTVLQGVFQSVLCNRIVFLAREPSEFGVRTGQTYVMSHFSIRFISRRSEQ